MYRTADFSYHAAFSKISTYHAALPCIYPPICLMTLYHAADTLYHAANTLYHAAYTLYQAAYTLHHAA